MSRPEAVDGLCHGTFTAAASALSAWIASAVPPPFATSATSDFA